MRIRSLADHLVQNRFRSPKEIRRLLDDFQKEQKRLRPSKLSVAGAYLKGTHNGVFYRIKVPPKRRRLPDIPKLPSSRPPPLKFKETTTHHVPPPITSGAQRPKEIFRDYLSRYQEWLANNWAVLLFNFGSICTLVGFTRSDVLELRMLSVTGSVCGVIYQGVQAKPMWPPIVWSMLFGGVNAWKIFEIVNERQGTVRLSAEQEEIYVRHFLPHGITPKQFEAVLGKAQTMRFNKGQVVIKKGEVQHYVYLVVQGSTKASLLGRHLTAVSVTPTAHEEKKGGASGAWIGEMAFLENCWVRDSGSRVVNERKTRKKVVVEKEVSKAGVDSSSSATQSTAPKKFIPPQDVPVEMKSKRALYTIVAKEDCTILRWSHADMQDLMARSTDMRAALTRAMAAAVVGKVINLTISSSKRTSPWSKWLADWSDSDARVEVDAEKDTESVEEADGDQQKDLPTYPIKKFR